MTELPDPWRKEGQIGYRVLGLGRYGSWQHIRTDVQSVEELNTVIEANLGHYSKVRVIPNVFIGGEYHHPLPIIDIGRKGWIIKEY